MDWNNKIITDIVWIPLKNIFLSQGSYGLKWSKTTNCHCGVQTTDIRYACYHNIFVSFITCSYTWVRHEWRQMRHEWEWIFFCPLIPNIHSVSFYKNDFYKKQGWNLSNLLNKIKKHSTKRLRLSWFGLFL